MKRFFSKPQQNTDRTHAQTQGLHPKYTPPIPHPCPHEHITLLVSPSGLLLRPEAPGLKHLTSHVHIAWGREVNVEEVQGDSEDQGDWRTAGVIIYGIVGILELTFASYLLVITSRSEVGHLFDQAHAVYSIKGVTPIPLVHDRALIAVNTLSSRNARAQRPSLAPSYTSTNGVDSEIEGGEESNVDETITPTLGRGASVTFAEDNQVKVMAPMPIRSSTGALTPRQNLNLNLEESRPGSPGSGASTPASVDSLSTSPIAKTVASRLSFWTRLSKRTPTISIPNTPDSPSPPSPSPLPTSSPNPVDRASLDSIIHESITAPSEVLGSILAATAPQPETAEERKSELEDKILRECVKEFTKGGMYFAYNFDITRSLQHKQEQAAKSKREKALLTSLNALPSPSSPFSSLSRKSEIETTAPPTTRLNTSPNLDNSPDPNKVDPLVEPYPTLPLWRRVDRQFWWNEWLSKPFIDAGLHSYVLPIMQGHYQITTFPIAREPALHESGDIVLADYIVISRRSRDRAGLRYQRRGVDEDAHVANFVESESVMRVEREGFVNIFSYVQIRGSVPLFWTQTGYGLKPPPLLSPERTHDQNLSALKRHFERTLPKYGPHCVVNLAEQQGKEAAITDAFRDYVGELGDKNVLYNEYDFHKETRGMKYENILKLVDNLQRTFESQGYFWISNNLIMSEQKGVFRVNCIDCLDRTNVVQSAFARHVLTRQLGAVALLNSSEAGKTEMDIVFNDVWANNGDAISRAYAGTSALKGDFTRTGKRDLGGLLNDGVNSLARMYTSTFSDWFCQAVIDFMLGYRTLSVFSEFLLKLQSTDPRELIRLSKIRAEAIATCIARVLPEGERLLSGWTLFAPEHLNTKIGEKFEEKVLLLTAQALYIISYDYTLDKIKIYTRVPLGDIIGITKGAYILSPLEEASRDPKQNAGFIISWRNNNQTTRVSSYSFRNSPDLAGPPSMSPIIMNSTFAGRPLPRSSNSFVRNSVDSTSSSSPLSSIGRTFSSRGFKKGPILSRILSNATPAVGSETTYAAFKALPVDPICVRRGSSTGYAEPADDLTGASTCKEAVGLMVGTIRRACEDLGSGQGEFIKDGDVVNLIDAQRMTNVYAKMEYGVKRLLWLGG